MKVIFPTTNFSGVKALKICVRRSILSRLSAFPITEALGLKVRIKYTEFKYIELPILRKKPVVSNTRTQHVENKITIKNDIVECSRIMQ